MKPFGDVATFCATPMKKTDKKEVIMQNCQAGRSMLEMLGVLSIIGVLSIGGIAGYSKMMTQYKINTCMQQINIMSSKLSAIGSQISSYGGLDNASAIKFNAVPAELISGTSSLTNPFGGAVTISAAPLLSGSSDDKQAYTIKYSNLPEEACLALASRDWNSSKSSTLLGVGVGDNIGASIYQGCTGDADVSCSGAMDISKARAACNCGSSCTIVMKFF